MTAKRIVVLGAALVVLCFALALLPDDVYAQRPSMSDGDDGGGLITQRGLATGKLNEGKGVPPTPVQMGLGIGSVVVMIIVVKWL